MNVGGSIPFIGFMNKYTDEPLSNRQKNKRAVKGLFYCDGCDADKVSKGGKCKACGYRDNKKKIR